jgi:hypothetical protein
MRDEPSQCRGDGERLSTNMARGSLDERSNGFRSAYAVTGAIDAETIGEPSERFLPQITSPDGVI